MNPALEEAAKGFTTMMKSGSLDGIVLYDLIECYKFAEDDDWKDALRRVIRYYASDEQYKEFKEKYVES